MDFSVLASFLSSIIWSCLGNSILVFCTRIRAVKLGAHTSFSLFIHKLTSFCPFRLEKCSLNVIELMLASVLLVHSVAQFLFAFLYTHMGKFKSGCLHFTLFSNKRSCAAFSRSVKGRMPPLCQETIWLHLNSLQNQITFVLFLEVEVRGGEA